MKILNSIYSGSYTEEQSALVAEIEQTLDLIMRNPYAYCYDCIDTRKYKKMMQALNRKFTQVFPDSPGLYVCQSQYCSLQWFIEQHLKDNVISVFSFKYTDELFRFAFIHELAIFTHRMPDTVLHPIQIRSIAIWLLLSYFSFKDFKAKEFARVFALASDCLNVDQSELQEIRSVVDGFKTLYQADIDDLNASKNLARRIRRKARRYARGRLKANELMIWHFMAYVPIEEDYTLMLKNTAKRYRLSYETIRRRAKAIGLTKERFRKELIMCPYYEKEVAYEKAEAEEILSKGPFSKSEAWEHYKKRFKVGRTFFSGITQDIIDDEMKEWEEKQQQSCENPETEYVPYSKLKSMSASEMFNVEGPTITVERKSNREEYESYSSESKLYGRSISYKRIPTCTPTFNASELNSEQDWLTLTTLQTVDAVLTYEWLTPPPAFAIERIRQATGGHYVTNEQTYIKPETDWANLTPEKMIDAILFSPAGTPIPETVFDAIIEAKERERNPTPVEPTPEKDPSEMTMEEIIATLF